MAYTLDNLRTDIRNYTEVDDSVLSNTVLDTIIKNTENKIYREADSDDNRFYATSNLQSGNRSAQEARQFGKTLTILSK